MRISDWSSDVCSSDLIAEMASAAAARQGCAGEAWEDFALREATDCRLPEASPEDICYLQYSSGSTRFPTGVAVTHLALLHNLFCTATSMALGQTDLVVRWIPCLHNM